MLDGFEYIGCSPHDGIQYRCKYCGQIVSGYSMISTNNQCPYCRERKESCEKNTNDGMTERN